jgi:hypothetical protein
VTELHWETVTLQMRRVMQTVGQSDLVPRFYLAGGTALALQLGHRRSIDLDFFSETDEVRPDMHLRALRVLRAFHPTIVEQEWGNLLLIIDDLHVGFFGYGYRLITPTVQAEGVPLASLTDIGLMKLDALAARASRKDFYDLYFIAQHLPLRDLFDLAPTKYPFARDFEALVTRYMVYFDRADQEEPPILLREIDWATVKEFFREQALALGKRWLE